MEVVQHFGDPLAEYGTLRSNAGILDLSFRGRLCLTGPDRLRFLNGQVTNNVKDLGPVKAAMPRWSRRRGECKVTSIFISLPDELLLDFEPGLTTALAERFEKFIIADDVQIAECRHTTVC